MSLLLSLVFLITSNGNAAELFGLPPNEMSVPNKKKRQVVQNRRAQPTSVSQAKPPTKLKVEKGKIKKSLVRQELKKLIEKDGGKLISGKDCNASDMYEYCPNFKALSPSQKADFWSVFMTKMVQFESGFDPQKTLTEKGLRTAKGGKVVSTGLFQISLESGRAYGCKLPYYAVLKNPYTNLKCGVKIVQSRICKDGVIARKLKGKFRGVSAYWAVLRNDREYRRMAQKAIKMSTKKYCKSQLSSSGSSAGEADSAVY